MVRICLVIPSLQAGGMERVMSELAGYFASKDNIELHIILYGSHREIFYPLPPKVKVHTPPFQFSNSLRAWYGVATLLFLRRKLKSVAPYTVLSFGEYWNSFVLLAAFGLSIPVFVSDRCQPNKSLGRMHDILRRILYPLSAGLIVQTTVAERIYRERFKKLDIHVIGNPIRAITKGNELKQNSVLMVGRFIQTKNQDKLIALFAQIPLPDWKLVLVGYDHMKQENMEKWKQLASSLGIADRVVFAGKQTDVDQFYNSCRIFAFTSVSEGFPNVIGEAMAAGLPVISFDCVAGPSDLITDGVNGLLVPLHDFDQFRRKLEDLMRNDSLQHRLGDGARQAISKYALRSIGDQYLNVIANKYLLNKS